MQRKNSTRRKRAIINYKHDNAGNVNEGDAVRYEPADHYTDGELVALEHASSGNWRTAYLFNVRGGKRYKYFIKQSLKINSREMLFGDDDDTWRVRGIVREVKATRQSKRPQKKTKQEKLQTYTTSFAWPYFGIHINDTVTVREDGQAKPGQLILVEPDKGGESYFTRCCFVKDGIVRVCDHDDKRYDRPASRTIGAVVEIRHDDCIQSKIEALRADIKELESSDDAITNSTQIFKLEREIFALEHPPILKGEDEVSDEWPDEIDG